MSLQCAKRGAFYDEDIAMSRPTKTADTRRSRQIIFRLLDAEYDRLCAKAELAGLAPNDLARRLTCKGQDHLVIKAVRHCDPAFLKRLDQIGHNLNQLVKSAHIFGRIAPEIEPLCQVINGIVTEALAESPEDLPDGP